MGAGMREEKFIGFGRLVEACGQSGCPVCRCLIDESRGHLGALLYEQVTDADTRRALRASWGFCNWHTWMLPEVEQSIFGAAIIYEDLVRIALERTADLGEGGPASRRSGWGRWWWRRRDAGARPRRRRSPCPVCVTTAESEGRYLDTLVRFADDGDLQAAYAGSDGLCLSHLLAALETAEPGAGTRWLVTRTRERWARLGRELESFVAKHDYRNREPYTEAEADSYTRAFGMLAGARGVFGNDLSRSGRPLAD
jgi:hypothetical protein